MAQFNEGYTLGYQGIRTIENLSLKMQKQRQICCDQWQKEKQYVWQIIYTN